MNILAANPDDGGLVGIVSEPLRENLTACMSNFDAPKYTRDITGTLSAIDSQTGLGANILSLSWGRSDADASTVIAYKKKFKKYEERRLDVLFVCAAGNDNKPMDGTHCFPGGFNLSNVITVGSIKNDGTNLSSSMSSNNFEVSLAAPGEEAIFYKDKTLSYKNRHYGGTSMAAPMVAGAAAIIRSLNSSLNASEIKTILLQTARSTVKVGSKEVRVPQKVGGRVLAIDLAVQRVIDSNRNATLK
jgi:hypothetical protein